MERRKNFLLVEDEALIREGLISLLQPEDFVGNIYYASNKKEFVDVIANPIDIILMDFKLQDANALELLEHLKTVDKKFGIIILTGLEGTELILNLLAFGVNGFVYKLDGYSEIKKTIGRVLEGESYYSERVLNIIKRNSHCWEVPPVTLSFAEKELLCAVASGLTTKEIADKLRMSNATIETYRIRLIKKLNVQNTASLIAYAFRNGLL